MKKVLLIVMPFASTRNPAIGVSLLKARMGEEGFPCDLKYLNLLLAAKVGFERYEDLCAWGGILFLGERLFAQEYFKEQLPAESEYVEYLSTLLGDVPEAFLRIQGHTADFLDDCTSAIRWPDYGIIGFSTMFEQNLASIALAERIKRLDPGKIIVFGGPNCEGEMGLELHRRFPFIDYICSGEADFTFPEFVRRLMSGRPIGDLPGLICRRNGESITTASPRPIPDLDPLPYPDYDDYFQQLEEVSSPPQACSKIPMETSRGCWWGQRSPCRFCGLNGNAIRYRSKSKDRVLRELRVLVKKYAARYQVPQVTMVDNILDPAYFKELLPELKRETLPVQLLYEVRANLNEEQVKMLSEAGVTMIGAGIESLNTHVLKLMAKGLSALDNIQLLKYCKKFQVVPGWSILTGFPGERAEDYRQMISLIRKITHLPPPWVHTRFQLERFSPYFACPEKYGLRNIRPVQTYRFVYPMNRSRFSPLAYFFDFDYAEEVRPPDFGRELAGAVQFWKECYARGEDLDALEISPSVLVIRDGRSTARVRRLILKGAQKEIYESCDRIRYFPAIVSHIRQAFRREPIREREVRDFLGGLVDLDLMVRENDRYISLAIKWDGTPGKPNRGAGS